MGQIVTSERGKFPHYNFPATVRPSVLAYYKDTQKPTIIHLQLICCSGLTYPVLSDNNWNEDLRNSEKVHQTKRIQPETNFVIGSKKLWKNGNRQKYIIKNETRENMEAICAVILRTLL